MTNENRTRIFDALLQGVRIGELEAVAADDVDAIEPIIDDIEAQAECRTRFQCWLESWHFLLQGSSEAHTVSRVQG